MKWECCLNRRLSSVVKAILSFTTMSQQLYQKRATWFSYSGKIAPNMLHNMELALEALRGRFVGSLQSGDFPRVRGPNGMFVCEVCGNAYLETAHLDTHSRYAH